MFDLDQVPDLDLAAKRAGCYLIVPDVETWHESLTAAGLPVTPLADQPWGMREFTLTDPNGNSIRIGRNSAGDAGTACSCELIEPIGKSQPTVSHHTKVLAAAGLIAGEKAGRWVNWTVVPERLAQLRAALAP